MLFQTTITWKRIIIVCIKYARYFVYIRNRDARTNFIRFIERFQKIFYILRKIGIKIASVILLRRIDAHTFRRIRDVVVNL